MIPIYNGIFFIVFLSKTPPENFVCVKNQRKNRKWEEGKGREGIFTDELGKRFLYASRTAY